jgi:cytochrome c oxidase cbb3-type subunit 4
MDLQTLRISITVIAFVLFVGIWLWAWSARRKAAFDEAARLPFDEGELPAERKQGDE